MKNIAKKALIMAGVSFSVITGYSQQVKVSGEIRPRTEYRHGYKTVAAEGQEGALFTDQRTRLNLDYSSESYNAKIVLQDVRVWGDQPQLIGNEANASSIHEAWGEVNFNAKFQMRFGRQEMPYDDHRILGNVGWAQQARSHDALLFKYTDSTWKLHFATAFNQDKAQINTTYYATPKNYKSMQLLWFHKDFKSVGISLLALNNGKQVAKNDALTGEVVSHDIKFSQTVGTRTTFKKNKLFGSFNGYYQMGNDGSSYKGRDLNALLIGLDFGSKLTDKLSATVGFEYQSGQSQTDTSSAYTSVNHAFSPFYGTNHKFNGFMDNFYVGNWSNSVGLQDIFARLKYKKEKYWVGCNFHLFSSAADILDPNSAEIKALNNNLGMEIDLVTGFKIANGVDFKGGYSHLLPSESLAYMKGVVDIANDGTITGNNKATNNWAWAMITIKPTFFNNK